MNRPRKTNTQLPPRVYKGKSAYEWHPKGGGALRLCGLDATIAQVHAAFEAAQTKSVSEDTTEYLIEQYFKSQQFRDLKPNTQRDYTEYSKKIILAFGAMEPGQIKPIHVRKYMDKRGQTSKVRANRERAFLSIVFAWCYERGMVESNPASGVRNFKEFRRERYVEDYEYKAVYDLAPIQVKAAMEISYLCAARQRDVLDIHIKDLREEGIYICQNKTGKTQIKEWTPRLKEAVELARNVESTIQSMYVIHNRQGQRYTSSGFQAMFKRAVNRALEEKLIQEKFTFHDLKRRALSNFEGDKRKFSGHKTQAMTERYNVKPELVETIRDK